MTKVGLLDFEFQGDPVVLEVHVFSTSEYSGDVIETEGMCVKYFLEILWILLTLTLSWVSFGFLFYFF